ncbi:MAG: 2Fe-2S iron-sulfur cluster binding domain-containing protein [Saprospiraceae bacterium]|nr:2Fe-2S iron-sulfur cluster binding domain-containing protein [Saprospiraceae bacterium]
MEFYKIKVDKVIQETEQSVSVGFKLDKEHPIRTYSPGQYLTLRYDMQGEKFLRCYSFSSLPTDEYLTFTVKKTKHGFISRELVENIAAGMELEVASPQGKFKVKRNDTQRTSHYFFAAGSGITPILSMIRFILEEDASSKVFLLYSNKKEEEIIFYNTLKDLQIKYQGQIEVFFTLTGEKNSLLQKIFNKSKTEWSGWKGRVDDKLIEKFFEEIQDKNKNREYYICGPGKFINNIEKILQQKNIANSNIHKEYFTVTQEKNSSKKNDPQLLPEAVLSFSLKGQKNTIKTLHGEKILEALIREGYDPPYSCSSGACSSCVAKKISGEIIMDSSLALDDSEIKEGYILTCQSRCVSEQVEIEY